MMQSGNAMHSMQARESPSSLLQARRQQTEKSPDTFHHESPQPSPISSMRARRIKQQKTRTHSPSAGRQENVSQSATGKVFFSLGIRPQSRHPAAAQRLADTCTRLPPPSPSNTHSSERRLAVQKLAKNVATTTTNPFVNRKKIEGKKKEELSIMLLLLLGAVVLCGATEQPLMVAWEPAIDPSGTFAFRVSTGNWTSGWGTYESRSEAP